MDSDSNGDSCKQLKSLKENEEISEQTCGKRGFWHCFGNSRLPLSSRLFRTFWDGNERVSSFLRWYSFGFLPIVWSILFVLYSIIT